MIIGENLLKSGIYISNPVFLSSLYITPFTKEPRADKQLMNAWLYLWCVGFSDPVRSPTPPIPSSSPFLKSLIFFNYEICLNSV